MCKISNWVSYIVLKRETKERSDLTNKLRVCESRGCAEDCNQSREYLQIGVLGRDVIGLLPRHLNLQTYYAIEIATR